MRLKFHSFYILSLMLSSGLGCTNTTEDISHPQYEPHYHPPKTMDDSAQGSSEADSPVVPDGRLSRTDTRISVVPGESASSEHSYPDASASVPSTLMSPQMIRRMAIVADAIAQGSMTRADRAWVAADIEARLTILADESSVASSLERSNGVTGILNDYRVLMTLPFA